MGEFDQPFDGIPADSEQEFSAKIADVDIRDDFMFSYVMYNRQICTELLQYLLPDRKISRIEYYELGDDGTERPESASQNGEPLKLDTQKSLNEAFNRRTVRLDVVHRRRQVRLQPRNADHAARGASPSARGCIRRTWTSTSCSADSSTTRLRPSFVIFICTFDPFDEGRYLYSFRNVCRETGAELDDEAYKLFFNTAGTRRGDQRLAARDAAVYERPEELSGRKGRPSADPLD